MKKVMLILLAVMFMASAAWAHNTPEFDAVGTDSANYFNDAIKDAVVANVKDGFGNLINDFSDWTTSTPPNNKLNEWFKKPGTLYPDPCFPGYLSAGVDAGNSGAWEWSIVLQMKPESDIDINIVDCVLKNQGTNIYTDAQQTGRYRAPWGELFFVPLGNPTITAKAFPGPYAVPGWSSFYLDARIMPGLLVAIALDKAYYTSKAVWEEGVVAIMPTDGALNLKGETMQSLRQGDRIWVKLEISNGNTADVRYGADSVILKYIGIVGTEFSTLNL